MRESEGNYRKGKTPPKTAKPHASTKNAKAHQATTSKAITKTAAHQRTRRVGHAPQSTIQPQNPVDPVGNFFGSKLVRALAREIGIPGFSSMLKKVLEGPGCAMLIQNSSDRRTKDLQQRHFGFAYCASLTSLRVFQQTV